MFICKIRVVYALAYLQLCSFKTCRAATGWQTYPAGSEVHTVILVILWLIKMLVRSMIGMQN